MCHGKSAGRVQFARGSQLRRSQLAFTKVIAPPLLKDCHVPIPVLRLMKVHALSPHAQQRSVVVATLNRVNRWLP